MNNIVNQLNGLGNLNKIETEGIKPVSINLSSGGALPVRINSGSTNFGGASPPILSSGSTNSTGSPTINPDSNVFRNITELLTNGINAYSSISNGKLQNQQAEINLQAEALRLQREGPKREGPERNMPCEEPFLNEEGELTCPKSYTTWYIIGGIVLVGAVGTGIYLATKK